MEESEFERKESNLDLLKKTIENISGHLGGTSEDKEGIISLRYYNFEGYSASLALRLFYRFPLRGCQAEAEFEELIIMGVDLLHDSKINPLGARLFVPIGEKENASLVKVLDNLRTPLKEDYRQAVELYLNEVVFPKVISEELSFNKILVDKLRVSGSWVQDADEIPEILVPFPVCLETLVTIVHELSHISDDQEILAEEWITMSNLAWQAERKEKTKEEVHKEFCKIAARVENRAQKKALKLIGGLMRKFPAPEFAKRLKHIDIRFREGKFKSGLLGVIDKEQGGIPHRELTS